MNSTHPLLLLPALALGLSIAAASAATPRGLDTASASDLPPAPDVGPQATDGSLLDLLSERDLEGRRWTQEMLAGRVVVLDFWATWCAPCLADLPRLRQLASDADDAPLVLGVALDRGSRAHLRSFLDRHRIDWPQFHDGRGLDGPLPRAFAVPAIPRTFLFDRGGRLVAVDLRGDALVGAARALARSTSERGSR